MEQKFGIKEKLLVAAIILTTVFVIWYGFFYIPQKEKESIEEMKRTELVIQCSMGCDLGFGRNTENFNKCLKKCIDELNENK